MALTYDQFIKKIGNGKKFYKHLNDELNHNGFQYQLGSNNDTNEFDPSGSCLKGGLYFSDEDSIHMFSTYGNNLAHIELLKDALFYIDPEGRKYKTNKFNITNIDCARLVTYENFVEITGNRKYFYTAASPNDVHALETIIFHTNRSLIFGMPHLIKLKQCPNDEIKTLYPHTFRTQLENITYTHTKKVLAKISELWPMHKKQLEEVYLFDLIEKNDLDSEKKVSDFFGNRQNCINICVNYLNNYPLEFYHLKGIYVRDVIKTLGAPFINTLRSRPIESADIHALLKNIVYSYPFAIQFIDQIDELCKIAVSIDCDAIKYVKDPFLKNKLSRQFCVTEKIK